MYLSYPKSGNTWVRFLLANALYPETEVDFHTIHELIPEVGKEGMHQETLPRPRLLKSHAPYRAVYPQTIYILRDGRDVYASYYHYNQPNLPDETTFSDFINSSLWPNRWSEHVHGWIDAAAARDNVLVVRFESLKKDSARELKRMLNFIGQQVPEYQIEQAAGASSFESMRRLEEERGRKYGKVERFVRKGKAGGWRSMFTKNEKDIFKRKDGGVLVECGYEEGNNW